MSLKGKFRQKLYKEDLIPVIKQGLFAAVVGGLLIGSLNLLLIYVAQYSLIWMLVMLMALFAAKRIRQSYMSYHIWYSIISILAVVFGFYLINVVTYAGALFVNNIVDLKPYLLSLNPLPYFWFILPWTWFQPGYTIFEGLFSFLFFGLAIYYAYRYSK